MRPDGSVHTSVFTVPAAVLPALPLLCDIVFACGDSEKICQLLFVCCVCVCVCVCAIKAFVCCT